MTNLNQILLKVNQGQGTVGKLVNDQEFYKNAKLTLQKMDKMADSLEDQGPLSVVGSWPASYFRGSIRRKTGKPVFHANQRFALDFKLQLVLAPAR